MYTLMKVTAYMYSRFRGKHLQVLKIKFTFLLNTYPKTYTPQAKHFLMASLPWFKNSVDKVFGITIYCHFSDYVIKMFYQFFKITLYYYMSVWYTVFLNVHVQSKTLKLYERQLTICIKAWITQYAYLKRKRFAILCYVISLMSLYHILLYYMYM